MNFLSPAGMCTSSFLRVSFWSSYSNHGSRHSFLGRVAGGEVGHLGLCSVIFGIHWVITLSDLFTFNFSLPIYPSLSILSPPSNPFLSLDPIISKDHVYPTIGLLLSTHRACRYYNLLPTLSSNTTSSRDLHFPSPPFPPQLPMFQGHTPWPRLQRTERRVSVLKLDCSFPAPSPVVKEGQLAVGGAV